MLKAKKKKYNEREFRKNEEGKFYLSRKRGREIKKGMQMKKGV